MSSQVSTFMSNTSDIENFEKRAKNPTLIQSIFNKGNVEQVAIDSFMAKKKLQKQRQELRNMIMITKGPNVALKTYLGSGARLTPRTVTPRMSNTGTTLSR